MDPAKFKAPYLAKEFICGKADDLRTASAAGDTIPVNVLDIAEFDLGLELQPVDRLRERVDIEALLLADMTTMLVDKDLFTKPKLKYRLNFSVAHEIGHLVLHRDAYASLACSTEHEWLRVLNLIPDEEYGWIESHANEFAGRLLVPPAPLREEFDRVTVQATQAGVRLPNPIPEVLMNRLAAEIGKAFDVSGQVVSRRLKRESIP
jgi:IrrE N-terminal-like domain